MSGDPTLLAERVILITGAGGGIGSEVARAAAAAGASCVLLGRSSDKLNQTYDAIVAAGDPEPALFPLDLTKAGEIDYQRLIHGIDTDFGRLDGLVHLATRFDGLMPLTSQTVQDWQRTMHVNVTAAFALTQSCLPLLTAAADASVLFAADRRGARKAFWGAYAASKNALMAMARLLALEHAQNRQLRFNAIDPGPTATALRRSAFPSDDPAAQPAAAIAGLFVHCLGPATQGINGQLLNADGERQDIDY